MPKLSKNQEESLAALRVACQERDYVSKAVWKLACPGGVSVNTVAMLKTGAVVAVQAGVSVNGKPVELYRPAA